MAIVGSCPYCGNGILIDEQIKNNQVARKYDCGHFVIKTIPIPKNETIEQWEKRTGEPYPDDGPVYWSHEKLLTKYDNERNPIKYKHPWILSEYKKAYEHRAYFNGTSKPFIDLENPVEIIVANHHGKPETTC